MKAVAVFPAQRELKVLDHPEPAVTSRTHVKLRMLDVGVCGTDKEIVSFEYGFPPPGSQYLILGHESLGEVVETGPDVAGFRPGDLVVPSVRRPCPENCPACRVGRQDFCYTGHFTERGINQAHGYMTELVVEEERYLNHVPRALREVAVLVEPLTIAEKGVTQLWQVQQRLPWACEVTPGQKNSGYCHKAVVLGAGPVGLLGAMKLVLEGFDTTVYSRTLPGDRKEEVTKAIGAKFVHAEDVTVKQLAESIGNIDVVYEAVGASQLAFEVIEYLGNNAVFIFTGVPGRKAPVAIDTDLITRDLVLKNQVILGTVNASKASFVDAIRDLAEFMSRWPDAVRTLITKRYPMEAIGEPLSAKAPGIKNVIEVGR